MRRIVLLLVIISSFLMGMPTTYAQDNQTISTPSGRLTLEIPDIWVSREFPQEEELQGLDSETLVFGTSHNVIDQYLSNEFFDGTIIFLSAYPYHVFEPDALISAVDMLADVTVFPSYELASKVYGGYEAAEYYTEEPGEYFIAESIFDTGEMTYRATIYSTRIDDYDLTQSILNSAKAERPTLDSLLVADSLAQTVTTEDGRLSFRVPDNWLYWVEGDNSISFATSGDAYHGVSYSFRPTTNSEVVFTTQRLMYSALREGEVKSNGVPNLETIANRIRDENDGLRKDDSFAFSTVDGQLSLTAQWLIQGDTQPILTQTVLLDGGDAVYVTQAQYSQQATFQPIIDAIFATLRYAMPATLTDPTQIGLEIGQRAPDFSTDLVDGTPVSLADYSGKVTLVNLWASWCGPCHREAPAMQDYYISYNGAFEILAVNVGETTVEASGFQNQYDLTFPILMDENFAIAELYGLDAYPTTYILGRDGVIIEKVRGSFTEQSMRDVLALYVGR